jgi:parallel beta-helix repeat protein
VNEMMREVVVIGIIIILLDGLAVPLSNGLVNNNSNPLLSFGRTLYVGGSGPGNFTIIQDAIDFAKNGDTIFVFDESSPYFENIIIDKSISLIGEKRHTTIIDGRQLGITVEITSNYVNLCKFTITNCSYYKAAGIKGSTNYSTISNNNIVSNNKTGLSLMYSYNNTISGNKIKSNRWLGVHFGYCNNNTITENIIMDNIRKGFNQYDSHNNFISKNIVSENEVGINIGSYCSNNIVCGNIALFNEFGIQLYKTNSNNFVRGNSIRWNEYGINLEYSYQNFFENNNFIRNVFTAHFETFIMDENNTNYWNQNFWNRPRILPKFIIGREWTGYGFHSQLALDIDRNPSILPNKIGESNG